MIGKNFSIDVVALKRRAEGQIHNKSKMDEVLKTNHFLVCVHILGLYFYWYIAVAQIFPVLRPLMKFDEEYLIRYHHISKMKFRRSNEHLNKNGRIKGKNKNNFNFWSTNWFCIFLGLHNSHGFLLFCNLQ